MYEKTLTEIGIKKQVERFSNSLSHAEYNLSGVEREIPLFKKEVAGNEIKIYIYFDDGVVGKITNIRLIDLDGDIVSQMTEGFVKESHKGLYILFKYKFMEEVDYEI